MNIKKIEEIVNNDLLFMSYQEKHTIYITEPGLYSLIFKSQKDEAEDFKDWVFDDVLPKIRKTGQYSTTLPIHNQLSIMNEKDLHYNVIKLIRNNIPDALIIAPFGEITSPQK